MELLRNSLLLGWLAPLLRRAGEAARRSLAGTLLLRLMAWVGRLCEHSLIHHLFLSESRTESLWRQSRTYKVLDAIANCVPRALHALYARLPETMEESHFVLLLRGLGRLAPYLFCLTVLALLSVHHSVWNNLYSLILSFASLVLLWLRNIRRGGEGLLRLDVLGPWPLLFLFISLASAFWSLSMQLSSRFVYFSITCALLVIVCVSGMKNEKQFRLLTLTLALGMIVACVYGFYQVFVVGIPASSSFTDLELNANMPGRVYSFFDNPNAFANVLVFFTPVMLSMGIHLQERSLKAVFFLAFLLALACMVMTYSRGAWLSFALGLLVMLMAARPRLIPLCLILVFIALPLLPSTILNRFFTTFTGADSSINSRTYIYTAVYEMICNHPLTGLGLGTSVVKETAVYGGYYHAHFPYVHAHSIYMEIWVESGIFALGAFLLTLFTALKKGVRSARDRAASPVLRGAALGSVGGVVGSLIFGITDYAWSYPRVMALFWVLAALAFAADRLRNEGKTKLS